jgi:hypothetical protein
MAFGMSPAPVEVPSVPAPVESMPASRKDTVSKTGQGVMGFAFAFLAALKAKIEGFIDDPFGALDTVSTFIGEHGWEAAAILTLVGFLGFKIIRALQRQDFNEGRYQPSGAAE